MKKYIDATQKLWLLGNFKHCLCELQNHCTHSRKHCLSGSSFLKKTVLLVKNTHRYYYVVSENLTNDYKAIYKPK